MQKSLVEATKPYYHPEPWTATELIGIYGSRGALAKSLLGMSPGARLPAKETEERKRYDAQLRSVERWYNYEHKVPDKQQRNPAASKTAQAKLNELGLKSLTKGKQGMRVQFDGIIGVNGRGEDYERDRIIPGAKHKPMDMPTFQRLVNAAQEAGEEPAMAVFNHWYGGDLYLVDGTVDIF